MKAFVTTVAGLSTRFTRGISKPVLKCIYYEKDPSHTLLYHLLSMMDGYDELIVVGGYQFDALQDYVECYIPHEIADKITLVYNKEYSTYGTGWSLYKGLQILEKKQLECILFAEGDLYVDPKSIQRISDCGGDVITVNRYPIEADKTVAVYFSIEGRPRYIYDTAHSVLRVPEPFKSIYNSAQIWKFANPARLFRLMNTLQLHDLQATNLALIESYFGEISSIKKIQILPVNTWINCNSIQDFRQIEFEQ